MIKNTLTVSHIIRTLLLLCGLFIVLQPVAAQTSDSTFDLYLLIGQSNMAGRGPVAGEYSTEGSDLVWMLDKTGDWVKAKHPLHFDKPAVAGVGPGLRFGIEMAAATQHKTGLIPCAVGGSSIDSWVPGGFDKATNTHPYDDALARLKTALPAGRLKAVLWLQGESDSDSAKAAAYLPKLIALIERLRTVTGQSNLAFVAGELGRFKTQYNTINQQLARLPAAVSHTTIVSSQGFTDKGDQTHFDSPSADAYGKRFADALQQLWH